MNYERDYSHTHCFIGQEGHEKHLWCCICRSEPPKEKVEDGENIDKRTDKDDKYEADFS